MAHTDLVLTLTATEEGDGLRTGLHARVDKLEPRVETAALPAEEAVVWHHLGTPVHTGCMNALCLAETQVGEACAEHSPA